MSGYELAAKLRAGGFCPPSLKLVAVTGYAKDAEALASGQPFSGHSRVFADRRWNDNLEALGLENAR